MRIAIFTESYEPIVNGVSVCVSTLRDGLTERGHEVFVFAPSFKGHKDSFDCVHRLPSTHTFLMPDYPFPLPFAPKVRERFADIKPDIVHTQTPFLLGVLGARWATRYSVPLVSTNHTLYTEYAHYAPVRPKALTRAFLVRLMRWYYSGCDAVVVPSKPIEGVLRSYGVKTPVEVIKTGVDRVPPISARERSEVRRRYGIGDDEFLLLYVGRIAREKNLRMLLAAYKRVLARHTNVRLMLVGGGPALVETQAYASSLGLDGRAEFAGMLRRPAISPIYAASDAFVFPSTTETQGIAICEAMSAGLPVVAVNAGGIPENVQDGVDGFLTNDDPDEFADRLSFLITHDRERAEMGARARESACDFSVERMVDQFQEFYLSVIEGPNRSVLPQAQDAPTA